MFHDNIFVLNLINFPIQILIYVRVMFNFYLSLTDQWGNDVMS